LAKYYSKALIAQISQNRAVQTIEQLKYIYIHAILNLELL